jgi:hypothetical protein
MDVPNRALELFENCQDWDATVVKLRQAVTRYWSRIQSIQLLTAFTEQSPLSATTVNGRNCTYVHIAPTHSCIGTGLRIEVLARDTLYLPADLTAAVMVSDVALADRIVRSGVSVNSRVHEFRPPLAIAVENRSLPMLSFLFSQPDLDANDTDENGDSFIQRKGHTMPAFIINAVAPRVDLHVQNKVGRNIIHEAMGVSHFGWNKDSLGAILRTGSDTLALCVDKDGKIPTAAMDICVFGLTTMVYAAQCRAFRAVYAIVLSCTPVPPLAEMVMAYYTDSGAVQWSYE